MKRTQQTSLEFSVSDYHSGDRVRVIDREATTDEAKKRIFYNHMRGMVGTVRRVYEEEGEIWVEVDRNSLPDAILARHEETELQMHQKWLDGLSDEARRRMLREDTKFSLRYSILVTPNHLIPLGPGEAPPPEEKPKPASTFSTGEGDSLLLNDVEQEFIDRAETGRSPE